MISIIICSRKADISKELKDNIAATIGCEYELCVIDNSRNEYNIFTAYNEGVRRAKGEILCFMHEDILFHSEEWGKIVNEFFAKHVDAGLMGVVGGQFIPNTPAYWGEGGCDYGVIIQGTADSNGQYHAEKKGNEFDGNELEVVAVDGQLFCIPSKLFETICFDETSFSGFHNYDVDICMQIATNGWKLYITKLILIEHKSGGTDDALFIQQNELLYKKWKEHLPICRGVDLSEREIAERTRMVEMKRYYWKQYLKVERELTQIRSSHAYQLGKRIIRPIANMADFFGGGGYSHKNINIDVIIVAYNQERYIIQAMEGLCSQIVDNNVRVHIIVADDCSTDKTFEIIQRYKDQIYADWTWLSREQNLGIAANYKRAIAATTGDYVAILEGDDYWTDANRLQKHIDYLSTHTDCVMTANDYMEYSQSTNEWHWKPVNRKYMLLREMIHNYCLANLSARVYRGDVLRRVENKTFEYGDRQRGEATDYYLTMDVLRHGYGYVLNEVMSVYRIDTNANISKREMSYDEFIERGKICCEQMLDMLGVNYINECRKVYTDAVDIVSREQQSVRVQRWSEEVSPFIAKLVLINVPACGYGFKHVIRQCIPNKLYRKIKRRE